MNSQFIARSSDTDCSSVTQSVGLLASRLGSRRLNDFPAGLWKLRLKSG